MSRRKKQPSPGRQRPRRRWGRALLAIGMLVGGLSAMGCVYLLQKAYWQSCADPCADMREIAEYAPDEASRVLDRNGVEIATFSLRHRRQIPLRQMPVHLVHAFLAVEDQRFYEHQGVDFMRVAGAALANIRAGGVAEGFSTITMQLARNVYPELLPMTERTLERKIREVRVAVEIEEALGKDDILERYLNTIFLGAGAYGVEAAALTYFGKTASELTLAEAALLASLPKAPSKYNPYRNREAAKARRDLVLNLMRDAGYATESSIESALAEEIQLAHESLEEANRSAIRVGHYFVEAVRQELEQRYGSDLYRGGLTITTTLDAALQVRADSLVRERIESIETGAEGRLRTPNGQSLQAALLVLDADSGDLLALVGGRDFETSSFDRARQAERQPGSAFKPFVYAAALAAGFSPRDSISDEPLVIQVPGGEPWEPRNFSEGDGAQHVLTLAEALRLSRNRAAARLGQIVGIESIARLAEGAGLGPMPRVPSLPLGVEGVRMIDLVSAYTTFARGDGRRALPRMVLSVRDRKGRLLEADSTRTAAVMDSTVARGVRAMLEGVVDGGTGSRVRAVGYEGRAAGKTGTTNDATDTWFVGVTPRFAAAVWIGFDVPATVLGGAAGTGGRLAAPVWSSLMQALPSGPDSAWVDVQPADTTRVEHEMTGETVPEDSLPQGERRLCLLDASKFEKPDTIRSLLVPCPPDSTPHEG